ncbi:MAG: hypothetical protein OXG79_12000 [Chloroflexi bacterium]|nr:hypothetical protein [Chloroflexota bacterium]
MMLRRFGVARGVLAALSVVLAVAAALALGGAERQWPAFPTYAFNLDFGPAFAGGSLEQTFAAPATPLRRIELRAVSPWPETVTVRVRDAGDPAAVVLVEASVGIAADGLIRIDLPGTVDTSGRLLQVQVVNPPESPTPLSLQANHTDPYGGGQAAIGSDPGTGSVDLVLQTWRRVTPTGLALEVLRANALGALFALATLIAVAGLALAWGWRRFADRSRSVATTAGLLGVAVGLGLLRVGFEVLAPWVT